jgi:hypothetical protein
MAPVETIVPSPITVGGSGSRFAQLSAARATAAADDRVLEHRTPSPSTVPRIDDR